MTAALPFVNWIFWASLAGGTVLAVGLTQWLGGTTIGYRRFMAATVAIGAGIWLLSELSVTPSVGDAWSTVRRALVWVSVALSVAYLVAVLAALPERLGSLLAVGGGVVAVLALLTIPAAGGAGEPVLFAAGLVSAALALGSVTAGMLLGHWYLVTPKLSPEPIRRLIWILIGSLVAQGLLVAWSVVIAWGVLEPVAWLSGLRFFVGVVFPLAIAILALRATTAPRCSPPPGCCTSAWPR